MPIPSFIRATILFGTTLLLAGSGAFILPICAQSADDIRTAAQQLTKQIDVAKSKGVGTKPYEDALKSITDSLATADGATLTSLKSRIDSLSANLSRQVSQMAALKLRPRMLPASPRTTGNGDTTDGAGTRPDITRPVNASDFNINTYIYTVRGAGSVGDVSPEFIEQVKREIIKLPRPLLAQLQARGCRVCITPRLADKFPDFRNTRPRGWELGYTGKNVDGLFDGRDVIVCEYSSDIADDLELIKNHRVPYIVRHESGHAFDHYWQNISATPEFKHTYYLELAHMDPDQRDAELAYFAQKSDGGPSECFAELFAIMNGGGASKNIDTNLLPVFPTCSKMIRQQLGF